MGLYDEATRLAEEKEQVEVELGKCKLNGGDVPTESEVRTRAAVLFDKLEEVIAGGTIEERREFVSLYVHRIEADPSRQTVRISLYPPLFNRESWVDSACQWHPMSLLFRLPPDRPPAPGIPEPVFFQDASMRLTDILQLDSVKVPLAAVAKQPAIFELIDLLAANQQVSMPQQLKDAVWQREAARTTGIGHGIAIPHGKCAGCTRLAMAIGLTSQPIEFGAIDGKPVQIIILLASPPDQTGAHIHALARISRLLSDDRFRAAIKAADNSEAVYKLIVDQDGKEPA